MPAVKPCASKSRVSASLRRFAVDTAGPSCTDPDITAISSRATARWAAIGAAESTQRSATILHTNRTLEAMPKSKEKVQGLARRRERFRRIDPDPANIQPDAHIGAERREWRNDVSFVCHRSIRLTDAPTTSR